MTIIIGYKLVYDPVIYVIRGRFTRSLYLVFSLRFQLLKYFKEYEPQLHVHISVTLSTFHYNNLILVRIGVYSIKNVLGGLISVSISPRSESVEEGETVKFTCTASCPAAVPRCNVSQHLIII